MIRTLTLAAMAAVAVAAPASAGEIRVSLAGKSPEQVKAEITSAARAVCLKATASETFRLMALDSCQRDTVAAAVAQIGGTQMAAADQKVATR